MHISQFKLPEDAEMAESSLILTSEYNPIQYEALPEISLPRGANHGLNSGSGSQTAREYVTSNSNRAESQSYRKRVISSPCRSKYSSTRQILPRDLIRA